MYFAEFQVESRSGEESQNAFDLLDSDGCIATGLIAVEIPLTLPVV